MVYAPGRDRVGDDPAYDPSAGAGGVFANWIVGSTPKYAKNNGYRSDLFKDTLSRIFIRVTEVDAQLFHDSVTDPRVRRLLPRVAGDPRGAKGYVDYLLQSVNLGFSENIQVSQTLADNYVLYTFGQQPPTASFQGVLINTVQDDQATNMVSLYLELFRATQLARRQKAASIKFDSYILTGAMINLRLNMNAAMEVAVPFTFDFVVKRLAIPVYTVGWQPTGVGTAFATDLNAVPADVRFAGQRGVTAVTFNTPTDTTEETPNVDPRVNQTHPTAAQDPSAPIVTHTPTAAPPSPPPSTPSGAHPELWDGLPSDAPTRGPLIQPSEDSIFRQLGV